MKNNNPNQLYYNCDECNYGLFENLRKNEEKKISFLS